MSYFEGILLGIVQGLGEFLPISSSAHLIVAPWTLNLSDAGLGYSVALHLGTLFAVLAYYYKDWLQLTWGSLQFVLQKKSEAKPMFREMLALILATIPAGLAGLFLEDYAETVLRAAWIPALTMSGLGLMLWFADQKAEQNLSGKESITFFSALCIGSAQALALIPGVSRSGITITVALFLGLSRTQAARFSFLLSTPIILGACVLKYKDVWLAFTQGPALAGLLTSAVFGFLSIRYLLKWIKTSSYKPFCYYRFIFSAVVIFIYLWRSF